MKKILFVKYSDVLMGNWGKIYDSSSKVRSFCGDMNNILVLVADNSIDDLKVNFEEFNYIIANEGSVIYDIYREQIMRKRISNKSSKEIEKLMNDTLPLCIPLETGIVEKAFYDQKLKKMVPYSFYKYIPFYAKEAAGVEEERSRIIAVDFVQDMFEKKMKLSNLAKYNLAVSMPKFGFGVTITSSNVDSAVEFILNKEKIDVGKDKIRFLDVGEDIKFSSALDKNGNFVLSK